MARERITLDVFELAELFYDFLVEGTVNIAGVEIQPQSTGDDDNNPGNQLASRMFAEYAMSRWRHGESVRSPLSDVFDYAVLLHRARIKECQGSLTSQRYTYKVAMEQFPELVSEEDSKSIETYLHACEVFIADREQREAYSKGRIDGVKESYSDRQKEAQAVISAPKLRMLIMERDGAKCKWCGETEGLALDHILPVVAGGTDDPENLQVLCGSCNSSKGDRVPSQFKEVN